MSKRIFWLAGEKSGDLHASIVIEALNATHKDMQHEGVCGPHMQQAGCKPLFPFARFSVMGFAEVIRHIAFFGKVEKTIRGLFQENPPDLVVLVDYPGLNMRIARIARKYGIPVLYYICPQFWAWKYRRIYALKTLTNHIAYILPFEGDHFSQHEIPASYVGHPIAQEIVVSQDRETFAAQHGLDASKTWIGFLPGSRDGEIRKLLPLYLQAMSHFHPDKYELLLSEATSVSSSLFTSYLQNFSVKPSIIRGQNYEFMKHCDAVVATSGTATLETAFLGTPFIIVYKTSALSYQIARHIIKINRIGLPNIILDADIIPELIQHKATARAIVAHIERILTDLEYRQNITTRLAELHRILGTKNAATNTAKIIEDLLK